MPSLQENQPSLERLMVFISNSPDLDRQRIEKAELRNKQSAGGRKGGTRTQERLQGQLKVNLKLLR